MTSNDNGGTRFATITPEDHSAWIWLAVLHSLCYSICFLGFRVIIKIHRYGLDDAVLALAYVGIAASHGVVLLIAAPAVRCWTLGCHFHLPLPPAWEVVKRDDGRAIARCFQGTLASSVTIRPRLISSRRCSRVECCSFLFWRWPKYPLSLSFDKSSRKTHEKRGSHAMPS